MSTGCYQRDVTSKNSDSTTITLFIFYYYPKALAIMWPQNFAIFKTVEQLTCSFCVYTTLFRSDVTSKTSHSTTVTLFIFYYYPKALAIMVPQNLAKFKTVAFVWC